MNMEIRFLASVRVSDQFGDLGASCSKNKCKKQGEVAVITTYTMAASYRERILGGEPYLQKIIKFFVAQFSG